MKSLFSRYDQMWTDLSLAELKNFARWMNRIIGYNPLIIGGWAVYLHSPGLGSRDIDVLLPSWEVRDRIVTQYLINNGYQLREKTFGTKEWVKYLIPNDEASETYLDICTLQDSNRIHGRDGEVPWSVATRWQKAVAVGDAEVFIPEPEPLLVLKAKAAWDRTYDLTISGGNVFLGDKVRKDRYDVLSLVRTCTIDQERLKTILDEYDFTECFHSAMEGAIMDKDAVGQHRLMIDEESALKVRVMRLLKGI